jgi:integrase
LTERSCILSGGPQAAVEGAAETSANPVEPSKDPAFDAITRDQLIDFPAGAWLRDEYLSEPDGAAPRGQIKLSPKTILNIHTDLSGLWTWGVKEGFVPANLVRTIVPPAPKAPVVETLTKEEIDALLGACDRGKTWKARHLTASDRPTAIARSSCCCSTSMRDGMPWHWPVTTRAKCRMRLYPPSISMGRHI